MTTEERQEKARELFDQYIADKGLRHTPERYKVLEFACSLEPPFTAEQVVEMAKDIFISQATVYNTFVLLRDAKILHRLNRQYGQSRDQYEVMVNGNNHMQFICKRCGRVVTFKDKMIESSIRARRYNNFKLDHYTLYVYGYCKLCRKIEGKKWLVDDEAL